MRLYHTTGRQERNRITSNTSQGSILGLALWNINYQDIFHIETPKDTHHVGYFAKLGAYKIT